MKLHEQRAKYKFQCPMVDGGLDLFAPGQGFIACDIRCKTQRHLDYHIQSFHTTAGLAKKLKSEDQMATFLKKNEIAFDRDHTNTLKSDPTCYQFTRGNHAARPDFYLPEVSSIINADALLGNDEFGHRRYPCDFKRVFNIANSLSARPGLTARPMVYIRFNPHFYQKDGIMYDQTLSEGHLRVLKVIQQLGSGDIQINPTGVSLIYINYDCTTINGKLVVDLFQDVENDTYAAIYKNCVVHVVG